MLYDKDYHIGGSIATSWFAIDLDGNVAIVKFGKRGPIPRFVRKQVFGVADAIFTLMAGGKRNEIPCMNFTNEQIDTMLSHAKQVKEVKCLYDSYYFFDGIIEIDEAYQQEIEDIMSKKVNRDKENDGHIFCRLSPNRLLYYTDCDFDLYPSVMKHVRKFFDFYVEEDEQMANTPFFYYKQERMCFPAIKCSSPICPFKSEQLPKVVVDKAIKLPIKFGDTTYFQIAKYYSFRTWYNDLSFKTIKGKCYTLIKDEIGKLHCYGTKHERPIEPIQLKDLLEQGKIEWECITRNQYLLHKSERGIMYESTDRDIVFPLVVWEEIRKVLDQIEAFTMQDYVSGRRFVL